jgi:putative addiction module CopG family antidote
MQITLPPEAQAIIERHIASGRFETPEEVVAEALQRMVERNKEHEKLQAEARTRPTRRDGELHDAAS